MNFFQLTQIGTLLLPLLQIVILVSGCEVHTEFTNEAPKIIYFVVPAEVAYGETVEFEVGAYDLEDDPLTYSWEVSAGRLTNAAEPEVQWTAPELPPEEVVSSTVVHVHVSVQDSREGDASETASIVLFSKRYKVMQALSGTYTLISKRVRGDQVEETGVLRLTTTTFTQEFRTSVDAEVQVIAGFYKLVDPVGAEHGGIHWVTDGEPTPSVGTYTWEGEHLVLFFRATSTEYIYAREEREPGDVDPEPINPLGFPIEITDETFAREVLNAKVPVVIEFRTDWSPFCSQMNPIVETVAVESRDAFIVGRLDIDKNPVTHQAYKVEGIPTYLVFRDGKEVARFAGPVSKPVFVQKILDALK